MTIQNWRTFNMECTDRKHYRPDAVGDHPLYAVINLTALIDEMKDSAQNLRQNFNDYTLGYINALNVVIESMIIRHEGEETNV